MIDTASRRAAEASALVKMVVVGDGFRLDGIGAGTHHLDLVKVSGGWRITETANGSAEPTRWWDYDGGDPIAAFTAVCTWHAEQECAPGTAPRGWVRCRSD